MTCPTPVQEFANEKMIIITASGLSIQQTRRQGKSLFLFLGLPLLLLPILGESPAWVGPTKEIGQQTLLFN